MAAQRQRRPRSGALVQLSRATRLGWRVLRTFVRNKGVLLASAVGYNALLSIIPLLVITLVVLSHIYDDKIAAMVLVARVRPLAPGLARTLREAIASFWAHREMVGWGGLLFLVVVSSVAFRMIEEAMAVIFRRPRRLRPRSFWTSLLIQFGYVPLISLAVVLLTVLTLLLGALGDGELFGVRWFAPLAGALPTLIGFISFLGLVAVLTSFYWVMPVVKIRLRLALLGGCVAAVLWEVFNALLAWFFEHLSLVNVLYGSVGTVIIVLVSMEVFAAILLVAAQLVAEVDRSWRAGLRWYEQAPELPPLSIEI